MFVFVPSGHVYSVALSLHLQMLVSLIQTSCSLHFFFFLFVDLRVSSHPLLMKLFVEVNKGHLSLNAASSKRATGERDDSKLCSDNHTSISYESRDSLAFSLKTDFCFIFLSSPLSGG